MENKFEEIFALCDVYKKEFQIYVKKYQGVMNQACVLMNTYSSNLSQKFSDIIQKIQTDHLKNKKHKNLYNNFNHSLNQHLFDQRIFLNS